MDEIDEILALLLEATKEFTKENNDINEMLRIIKKIETIKKIHNQKREIEMRAIEKHLESIRKISRYHSIALLLLGIQAIMINFFLFH